MRVATAVLAAVALVSIAVPAPARAHVAGRSERLAARARCGDRIARTILVEEHMGLVRAVAARYRNLGLPLDDLVQEGAIGLLAAIDDYDSSRGASFSTYAFWRIRAAVTGALTSTGRVIRLPRPLLERRRQVAAAREQIVQREGEPSVARLADATALTAEEVAEVLAPATVASLDQPIAGGRVLGEAIEGDPARSPHTAVVAREEARALRGAVRGLSPRKRAIVSRHYGLSCRPQPLTEIAQDLELSPERTRALKDEALRELALELSPATTA